MSDECEMNALFIRSDGWVASRPKHAHFASMHLVCGVAEHLT
jgi:hypothetical protein